jgi:hypothetical protein
MSSTNLSSLKKEIVFNKMNTIMLNLKKSMKRKKALEQAIDLAKKQVKLAEKELEEIDAYVEEVQDKYYDFTDKAFNMGWTISNLNDYEEMLTDHLNKKKMETEQNNINEDSDDDNDYCFDNELHSKKKLEDNKSKDYCECSDKTKIQNNKEFYEDTTGLDRKNKNHFKETLSDFKDHKKYKSKPISEAAKVIKCKNKALEDLTLGDFDLDNGKDRKLFNTIMRNELNSPSKSKSEFNSFTVPW